MAQYNSLDHPVAQPDLSLLVRAVSAVVYRCTAALARATLEGVEGEVPLPLQSCRSGQVTSARLSSTDRGQWERRSVAVGDVSDEARPETVPVSEQVIGPVNDSEAAPHQMKSTSTNAGYVLDGRKAATRGRANAVVRCTSSAPLEIATPC
jgi:hypothetical protein